jgi:hypothetical protein
LNIETIEVEEDVLSILPKFAKPRAWNEEVERIVLEEKKVMIKEKMNLNNHPQ